MPEFIINKTPINCKCLKCTINDIYDLLQESPPNLTKIQKVVFLIDSNTFDSDSIYQKFKENFFKLEQLIQTPYPDYDEINSIVEEIHYVADYDTQNFRESKDKERMIARGKEIGSFRKVKSKVKLLRKSAD